MVPSLVKDPEHRRTVPVGTVNVTPAAIEQSVYCPKASEPLHDVVVATFKAPEDPSP
jgi:hypothetical protein